MRRDFLKLCGLVGLGLAWPGGARALLAASAKEDAPYDGPYYVVFNASGGWDTTYLMDPKGIDGINRLYEQGDGGANSILIAQAKHFTLLIGNYSREGFNHPGPAYMYVQAAGQWLFFYALHLVPTAWNAHVLAVFVLNSAFVAMVTGMVYGWTRSLRGAGVALDGTRGAA